MLTAYTLILAFAAVGMLALSAYSLVRRGEPGAWLFALLCLGGFCYAFGSIFEIRSRDAAEMMSWLRVEYLGIVLLGPCWMNCAIRVATVPGPTGRLMSLLSFAPSIVAAAIFAGTQSHHLFYAGFDVAQRGPFAVPVIVKGPWYLIHYGYFLFCTLVGLAYTLRAALEANGERVGQAVLLTVGLLLPWIASLVYQFGWSPYGLDTAPVGIALSCFAMGLAIFRYRLFDIVPLAFENVFHAAPDPVVVFDAKDRLLAANRAWRNLFPQSGRLRPGTPAAELLAGHAELLRALDESTVGGAELRLEPDDGDPRVFEVAVEGLRDHRKRVQGRILLLHDVSARDKLRRHLELQAMTDGLTGVANRRYFLDAAERELARANRLGEPLALAILDIDHFKAINDGHGHLAGDEALRAVTAACAATLRGSDLFARLGGEEFVVLLPATRPECVEHACERLRAAVAGLAWAADGEAVALTVSVGAAIKLSGERAELPEMLAVADAAMYRAKAAGRNRVAVDSIMAASG